MDQSYYAKLIEKVIPSGRGDGMKGAHRDHQESILRDYRAGKPMPKSDYQPPPTLQAPQLPQQNPMSMLRAMPQQAYSNRSRRPVQHQMSKHLGQLMSGNPPAYQAPEPIKQLFEMPKTTKFNVEGFGMNPELAKFLWMGRRNSK